MIFNLASQIKTKPSKGRQIKLFQIDKNKIFSIVVKCMCFIFIYVYKNKIFSIVVKCMCFILIRIIFIYVYPPNSL